MAALYDKSGGGRSTSALIVVTAALALSGCLQFSGSSDDRDGLPPGDDGSETCQTEAVLGPSGFVLGGEAEDAAWAWPVNPMYASTHVDQLGVAIGDLQIPFHGGMHGYPKVVEVYLRSETGISAGRAVTNSVYEVGEGTMLLFPDTLQAGVVYGAKATHLLPREEDGAMGGVTEWHSNIAAGGDVARLEMVSVIEEGKITRMVWSDC